MNQQNVRITVQLFPTGDKTFIHWEGAQIDDEVVVRSGVLRHLLDLPAAGTVPVPISEGSWTLQKVFKSHADRACNS